MPAFINPIEILEQLELKPEMTAADFGAGSGGMSIPTAKRLEKGRVFAIDIQAQPLSALESKAKLDDIRNIRKIVADIEKPIPGLSASSCDLVFIVNSLFEIDNKKGALQQAKTALRPGGQLVIVDWLPEARFGPQGERINPENLKEIIQNMGLRLKKELNAGDYHYGLVFAKS